MSKEMSIPEIINELDKIDNLYYSIRSTGKKIDSLVSVENKEELSQVAEKFCNKLNEYQTEQEEKLPAYASDMYVSVPNYPKPVEFPKKNSILGGVSLGLIYLTVILLCIGMFGSALLPDGLGMKLAAISLIMIIPTVIMCKMFPISGALDVLKCYDEIKEYEENMKEAQARFDKRITPESKEVRYKGFMEYEAAFLACVEDCDKKFKEESACYDAECEEIIQKNQKKLEEYHRERDAMFDELASIDLIPEDLFYISGRISTLLKQKRADSLKEAINLALDEERKDEEEEARREEAERQERILERQADDNRRHNEAMARQAEADARAMREHNAAMERAAQAQADAAQAQAREAQRQARMAQEQASAAWRNAQERCRHCVKYGSCGVRGDGIIGCPAFTPR